MTLFNSWILFGFISLHDILSSLFVQLAFLFLLFLFFRKPFDFNFMLFFMLRRERKRLTSIIITICLIFNLFAFFIFYQNFLFSSY